MKKLSLALLFLILPTSAFAAEFVQQPLFLSKSPVTEGTKVRVYANVSNEATTTFAGNVLITADGAKLGSPAATLDIGATQTVSVSWTPTAGDHTVTAQLTMTDGTVLQQVSQVFSIQAIPVPGTPDDSTGSGSTLNQSTGYVPSTQLRQALQNISPAVASTTAPVFSAVDNVRASVANTLTNHIAKAQASSASSHTPPTPSGTMMAVAHTSYTHLLSALRSLVDNPPICYSILGFLILFGLWKLYRIIAGSA